MTMIGIVVLLLTWALVHAWYPSLPRAGRTSALCRAKSTSSSSCLLATTSSQEGAKCRFSVSKFNKNDKQFFHILQEAAESEIKLVPEDMMSITKILQSLSENMDARTYSGLVFQLGNLKAKNPHWKCDKDTAIMLDRLPKIMPQYFNGEDLYKMLSGFHRLGINWTNLRQRGFTVTTLAESTNEIQIQLTVNLIYSLGLIGASWGDFSSQLRSNLFMPLMQESSFSSFSVSSITWGFAKLGCIWSEVPESLREPLIAAISKQSRSFTPQQASKLIWGLGTMGVNYHTVTLPTLEILVSRLEEIKKSKMGNADAPAKMLQGVGKMGVPWTAISTSFRRQIQEQALRVFQSCNDQGIVNCMRTFGNMQLNYTEISSEVEDAMFASTSRILSDCTGQNGIGIVLAFVGMGYRWDRLPLKTRNDFLGSIRRCKNTLSSIDVGNFLYALGVLEYPMDSTSPYYKDVICNIIAEHIDQMSPYVLSKVIWGLSDCEICWDQLPPQIQWGIFKAIRLQENNIPHETSFIRSAYGLTLMMFDSENTADITFRGIHETLLSIVSKNKETLNCQKLNMEYLEQLRIYCHFLNMNNFVADPRKIPQYLLNIPSSFGHSANKVSALQKRIISALNKVFSNISDGWRYSVSTELSSFDGVFPVDAMVQKNGRIVALIEVDGPQHTRWYGKRRRKDLLKESMYNKIHPGSIFHRIDYQDENKIGADVLAEELVAMIEEASKKFDNILFNSIYNLQKATGDFLTWGLRNSKEY